LTTSFVNSDRGTEVRSLETREFEHRIEGADATCGELLICLAIGYLRSVILRGNSGFRKKVEEANVKNIRDSLALTSCIKRFRLFCSASTQLAKAQPHSARRTWTLTIRFTADFVGNMMFNAVAEEQRDERAAGIVSVLLSGLMDAVDRVFPRMQYRVS
jgi:hypothetical protein